MIAPASGRLLELLTGDLPDQLVVRRADGLAAFPAGDGTEILVGSRVKRRFLGRTETAVFQAVTPALHSYSAVLRVRQTGALRRRAVEVRLAEGAADATEIASSLASDPSFQSAANGLDFTRFDIELDGQECAATIELMGASLVAIALPPIRSYVRLHPDQRDAITRCLRRLAELVA